MALPADFGEGPERKLRILDALGTAWSVFTLYPDPASQSAFIRCIETLAEPLDPPVLVAVGPGTFVDDGEDIDVRREGTQRLARELFLHDVEYVLVRGEISATDLVSFFEVLEIDDDVVREEGGVSALVARHGDLGIDIYERGLLLYDNEDVDPSERVMAALLADADSLSEAATAATKGASAVEVAQLLEALSKGTGEVTDPAVAAFLAGLEELHAHTSPVADAIGDVKGALREGASDPWKGFRTFLESFFYLSRPAQLMVLETILDRTDTTSYQLFLDQLSGADLAEYVPELSKRGREALTAYAVIVSSETGRPGDEPSDMSYPEAVATARQAVAARIAEVLDPTGSEDHATGEHVAELKAEMVAAIDDRGLAATVLRGLLECETRSARFARVLRVWTGRVSRHFRDGEWRVGQDLLSIVLDDPPYGPEHGDAVQEALERVAGRETFDLILDREQGSQPSDDAQALIATLGVVAVRPLVSMLAAEEDGQARRLLTELLAEAASEDPVALEPHLTGQPWYVLRNLATVLGKTGNAAATPGLRTLMAHKDHRVRVEALRSYVRVSRDEAGPVVIRMLSDDHERVRQNAVALTRSIESSALDAALAHELESERLPEDVAIVAVRILASRGSEEGRQVVRRLAKRKFIVSAGARALRDAAKEALGAVL